MGILDRVNFNKQQEQPVVDPNKLTQQELQLALQLLKLSTITGEQVEVFYNLVIKIQNQYLEYTK